ncbi:lysine decarboxylase [Streptomyces sp. CG 926]|uniref:aminotransferase class I/II-fold pyridoxal phosphate-dependent enzyme n=1 Tax=Streptomyces sp. CG 926 TaxID=1882405 RepID=UPI000D78D418|nr:PLP-dependent transferase [Streptomyces sp. CG 926]PWK66601.1 lysine decarboxylase [Streptomyces sp. CG 926]
MNTRTTDHRTPTPFSTPSLAPAPAPGLADDGQSCAPYAEAVLGHAGRDWLRLNVPGHAAAPGSDLADFFGSRIPALDFPPLLDGVDLGTDTPLDRALALAAEAWGARRTWFLTNGASQGNQIASMVAPALGRTLVVQRSVHSSVIDGLVLSGLDAVFVQPSVDPEQGIAHGVTATDVAQALERTPDVAAVYIVSPSYFGAVADVRAIADAAHAAGVPLIVDEAWGSHFGFHPALPANALSSGADLATSSTHKLAGSLTQSAMLHLAQGPFADLLEPLVDRAFRLVQSTSASALLTASLDLARRSLVSDAAATGGSVAAADRVRGAVRALDRFGVVSDRFHAFPDIVAADPLRIAIDTRTGGITGHEARRRLFRDHQIMVEVATDAAIVAVIGAGSVPDTDRFVEALHALPSPLSAETAEPVGVGVGSAAGAGTTEMLRLPAPGATKLTARAAFLSPALVVAAEEAVGRISADTLAAYPPGIPNVLPGEVITAEAVRFLQRTAAAPNGHVRGAVDPGVTRLRVVA